MQKLNGSPLIRRHVLAACALALALASGALNARAQMPKVFVALTGSDSNAGTSTSPKRTFQAAQDAVAAGGEIVVLSTAGYGAVSITKSLTITVPTGANGFVTVTGGDGITVNAGDDASVTIRGLTIEGDGSSGLNKGIYVTSVGQLTMEDCTIRSFADGVYLTGNGTSKSTIIRRGAIRDCAFGIYNTLSGSGSTSTVVAEGVTINHCGGGVYTNSISGTSITTLTGCLIHAEMTGIQAAPGAVNFVDGCTFSGCTTVGVTADAALGQTPGGVNYSRGNNLFTDNVNNGSFNGTVFAQ